MSYDRYKTIPGVPGDENTAVTMQSIKEILESEGASHLLMRREKNDDTATATVQANSGPLKQLAQEAKQSAPAIQAPPAMPSKPKAGKAALPQLSEPAEPHIPEQPEGKPGLLPRLFGRK